MFKCENKDCKTIAPARQPENRIVIETRAKTYENTPKKGKLRNTVVNTYGHETVKEIKVCSKCFNLLTGLQPAKIRPANPIQNRIKPSRPSFKKDKKQWTNPRKDKAYKGKKTQKKQQRKPPVVEVINSAKKNG